MYACVRVKRQSIAKENKTRASTAAIRNTNKTFGYPQMFLSVLRWIFGGALIAAGLGKLLDVRSFAEVLARFGLDESSSRVFATLIPPGEIVVGILIMLISLPRIVYLLVAAGFIFGAIISFSAYLRGQFVGCGCFGVWEAQSPSIATTLTRDIVLIILGGFIAIRSTSRNLILPTQWSLVTGGVISSLLFAISGYSLAEGPLTHRATSPEFGVSEGASLLGALPSDAPNISLIFVLSSSCRACMNSIENIKAFRRERPAWGIFVMFVDEGRPDPELVLAFGNDISVLSPDEQDSAVRAATANLPYVPIGLRVENRKVVEIMSLIPSPYWYNRRGTQ